MILGDLIGGAGASLAGGLFGGAFRAGLEVLKFLDKKEDRKHEAVMFDKQLQADEMRSKLAIDQIHAQEAATVSAGDAQAFVEAVRGSFTRTGVAWVDALNALVRPVLTFWWCIGLATWAQWAALHSMTKAGLPIEAALLRMWGPDEKAIVFSMIAFWFVDRALRKGGGVGPAR